MRKIDSLNQYINLSRQVKSKTAVSNCVLLPATVVRLCDEGRLYYEILSNGIAFFIFERGYWLLQLVSETTAPLKLPVLEKPVLCNLLYHGDKPNVSVEKLHILLESEGFGNFRSSKKMQLLLDTGLRWKDHAIVEEHSPLTVIAPLATDLPELIGLWRQTLRRGIYDLPMQSSLDLENIVCIYRKKELIAAALCSCRQSTAVLEHIAVKQELQKKGYGGLLLTNCLEKMTENNVRRCILWVEDDNENARKMYLKYGFDFTFVSSIQMIKESNHDKQN